MKIFISIIIVIILCSIFVIAYVLNNRTPKPDGCLDMKSNCDGCLIVSCLHNKILKKEMKK